MKRASKRMSVIPADRIQQAVAILRAGGLVGMPTETVYGLAADGGACEGGIESTIVDCTGDAPTILRPGLISAAHLSAILHTPVGTGRQSAPRVSGSLNIHYAPKTATRLFSRVLLQTTLSSCDETVFPLAVLLCGSAPVRPHALIHYVRMPDLAADYAHDRYKTLSFLSCGGFLA